MTSTGPGGGSGASSIPEADLRSFTEHLKGSKRILALLGAGLSAASGLPTFRGTGGLWRRHGAVELACEEAFMGRPDLVWQFYSYRRHMAFLAKPNMAHFALAELAKRNEEFITVTQNVDGLSQRAGHPEAQLHEFHGSLLTVKCAGLYCKYSEKNNLKDPICPALALPQAGPQPEPATDDNTGEKAAEALTQALNASASQPLLNPWELDIADASVPLPGIPESELPHCPNCGTGLLRPGVVWFGEALPEDVMEALDGWIETPGENIDLILVVGTSAAVNPAAGYVEIAKKKGARVAVVNMDKSHLPQSGMRKRDWFFEGDASVILPEILKPIIGEI